MAEPEPEPEQEPAPMTAAEKKKAKKARQKARQRAETLAAEESGADAGDGGGGADALVAPGGAAQPSTPAPAPVPGPSSPAAMAPCAVPSPRLYFSMVAARHVDAGSDVYLVLFGGELMTGKGRSQRIQYFKDTLVFSVVSRSWTKVDTSACSPSARSGHHATVVGAGTAKTMYMFGGEFGNAKGTSFTHLNDTWAFDAASRRWAEVKATGDTPSARSGHRTVGLESSLLLFGGFSDNGRTTR
jgi:hypothetical protein